MAYEGDVMTYCPGDLSFAVVYAVVVSGDFPNPCGHAALVRPQDDSGLADRRLILPGGRSVYVSADHG